MSALQECRQGAAAEAAAVSGARSARGILKRDFLMNGEIMPSVASIRQMDVFLALPFGPNTQTERRGDETST